MALTTLETVLSNMKTALQADAVLAASPYGTANLQVVIVRHSADMTTQAFTKYLIALHGQGIREERRIGKWLRRYFLVELFLANKTAEVRSSRLSGVGTTKGIHEFAEDVRGALLGNRLSSLLDPQPMAEIQELRFVDTQDTTITTAFLQWQGLKHETTA